MSDETTPNYGWPYPTVNADEDSWGTTLNGTITAIDAKVKEVSDVSGVKSVAGKTGVVTLAKADITDAGTGAGTDIVISSSAPSGTPTKPTVWYQV